MASQLPAAYTISMSKFNDAYWNTRIEEIARHAVDEALERQEDSWDEKVNEAIERAIGVYSEDLNDKMDLVLESTDFIKTQLDNMVTKDEFNELKTEVRSIAHALKATNDDVRNHEKRITKLEAGANA